MTFNLVKKVMCIGGEGTPPTFQFYKQGFHLGGKVEPTWRDVILSGNTALTLVNAKADSLEYLKLFGGTEQRNLPSEYTRVEYLESIDTQYIDLGDVLDTSTDDIEIEIQLVQTEATNFFGARNTTTQKPYTLATSNGYWRWGWKNNSNASEVTIDLNKHVLRIDHTNNTLSLDGTVIETKGSASSDIVTPTTPTLFAIHTTSQQELYLSPVRIFAFRKWRNGELVQSVVSCRRNSDNVLGMYDTVTGDFLTNQGTGTFAAGADVVPTPDNPMDIWCNNGVVKVRNKSGLPLGYQVVDGITNSGNKQIDIGNSLNQDDEIELVFSFPTSGITQQQIFGRRASANENNISIFFAGTANRLVVDFNNSDYSAYRLTADVSPNTIYTVLVSKSRRAIYQGNTLIAENTTVCNDTITISAGDVRLYSVGGSPAYNAYFTGTIYSLKIKNKRNMIACKRNSDNVVGFYNNVSNENFYALQGGTAGADINDLEIYTDGTTETVEITGENLYNPATRTDGYYINSNGVITQSGTFCYSALIPVKPNTDYMLSGTANQTYTRRLHAYDSNGNWISQIGYAGTTAGNTYNITGTTPNNCVYVRISIPILDTNVQLELGLTATAENLFKVGDYQDVQSIIDGSVTRNIGIKVLDGTESYERNAAKIFTVYVDDSIYPSGRIAILSSHFVGTDKTNSAMPNNSIKLSTRSSSITHGYAFIKTDVTADNASDFKQWVTDQYNAGTPVIIVYPLATATTETVTAQPMNIQAGTNVVEITQASMDNLELEVKYKAGVEVTITEIENAQLDDNVEVTIT